MKKKSIIFISIAVSLLYFTIAFGASVGQQVGNVKLLDPNDNPKLIPGLGTKVITIMYTDPDEKDVNDPLSDAIKAAKFSLAKYQGIGIANAKRTWIPNSAIRYKSRQKEKQFKGSVILIDESKLLEKKWALGNGEDVGIVIVIGKDKKIKYIKKVKTKKESKAISGEVLSVIKAEIGK